MTAETRGIAERMTDAVMTPRGLLLCGISLAGMISMAHVQGCVWHLAAAGMFALCLLVILALGRPLPPCIREPLRRRLRGWIDRSVVAAAMLGTFVPFVMAVVYGRDHLNAPSLLGATAVLAFLLDPVVFFRRRVGVAVTHIAVVWSAIVVFKPHIVEFPEALTVAYLVVVAAYTAAAILAAVRSPLSRIRPRWVLVGVVVGTAVPASHLLTEAVGALGIV